MIRSVGGKINDEEPAWVKDYNAQSEINRLNNYIAKLKKKLRKKDK